MIRLMILFKEGIDSAVTLTRIQAVNPMAINRPTENGRQVSRLANVAASCTEQK